MAWLCAQEMVAIHVGLSNNREHLPGVRSPAKQFTHHSPLVPSAHFTDEETDVQGGPIEYREVQQLANV